MTIPFVFRRAYWVFAAVALVSAHTGWAQQVQVTTPFHSLNDSYYENFGIGLSPMGRMGNRGGWFFSGTPANSTPPQFGGYDPSADATFGFRIGQFGLNAIAGQGSNRSHVMEAPTVVIPNGGSGGIFSGSQRPFVMGVIPIVGNAPMAPMIPVNAPMTTSPLAERIERMRQAEEQMAARAVEAAARDDVEMAAAFQAPPARPTEDDAPLVIRGGRVLDSDTTRSGGSIAPAGSTANRGDLSLQEIQQQQSQRDAALEYEVAVLVEKARGKEAEGKPGLAKIYYQQAASRADGQLKQEIEARIRALSE
jgi:hypothetical protein